MARATLFDLIQSQNPDGSPAIVAEVLNEKCPIVQDAHYMPSNAPFGNRVTIRSSLPSIGFSKINEGLVVSKSTRKQRTDTIAILQGLSEVDAREKQFRKAGFNAYRMGEDRAFIEAFAQAVTEEAFYGDESVNEAGFTGFAARMGSLQSSIYDSQVHSAGSVTGSDGTSMYIIDWGEDGASLIYPMDADRGTAGVDARDLGEQRVHDASNRPFQAFVTEYMWLVGLTVKDPRHIARLANIDISDANAASPSQGTLVNKLIDLLVAMPEPHGMQRVIYCRRELEAAFIKQAQAKNTVHLTMQEYLGRLRPHFWGYPIRSVDRISSNESTVS